TELAMNIEDQIARVEELQEQVIACNAELQDKRDAQKRYSSELNTVRSTLQQQRGRFASLEALQQAAQADATGDTDAWLQTQQLSSAPRLLDQLKVDGGWEVAVETVLGDSLQAVTLDTIDNVIGQLGTIGKSNVSFIELGSQSSAAQSNTGLFLLSSKVTGVETGALLHGVFVAETLEQAASARSNLTAHESIVTKDGIWVGPNWLRVIKQTDSGSGVIERRKSLLSLEQEISESEASIEHLENALKDSENALLAAENNKDRLLNDKATEEQTLAQHRSTMSALSAKIDQIKTRFSRTQEEIRLAEQNQVQQREALTQAREQLDIAIESMQEVEELRENLLLERDKVRDTLTISRETARTDREALQAVAVRAEGLRAQLDSVRGTVSRLTGQVEQLELRSASLLQSQEENNAPIAELKSSLAEQLETRVAIEESLSEARKSVEALDQSMREAEQARASGEQKTQDIRSRLEKLRIDSQEMAVRTKTIEEQLEESGFKLEAVLNLLPEDAELSVWQSTLEDIDRRINRLGAINLAAIEEFETESERKNYLDSQNDELESALATLEGAIQKIDKETRSLFKDTFDKLNASLQDLFPKVFGGGTAYLEMTGDDLLDTGIAIMARPPGKRNSTIHLLSGGEKALTAIALVFSIFQLNPAPFCMLDEVDAPLDDANTTRYARLIKEMSDRVQFIFITHNKITMEMADHLMGVTMHEPGCSRLVSVDIDEAVALATA
ncbi:MAG: chromosome segregation protein SMC, partial [Cellvibrionales bacterium]|nr:chromosome segregation protein SMC [Cellvibrionales bacterium]